MEKFQSRLVIIATIIAFSLFSTVTVHADDGAPPPPTDVPVVEDIPPAEDPPAGEISPTIDPAAEESPTAAEQPTLPEIMEAAPEGTDLVVLDENGEALPLVSVAAAEVLAAPDPFFTVGSTTYRFFSPPGTCVLLGYTLGVDCFDDTPTPIQDAIDYLATTLHATPADGNVYVQSGLYNEDVAVIGGDWITAGGTTPLSLGLIGAGSPSTMLIGSFYVQDMYDFTLSGFTLVNDTGEAILIDGNQGMLQLTDLDVTNTSTSQGIHINTTGNLDVSLSDVDVTSTGTGIRVFLEGGGDVMLDDVSSSGNGHLGADVVTMNGDITVAESDFSNNGWWGLGLSTDNGDATVAESDFSNNGWGGLVIMTYGDEITLRNVTATGNGDYGVRAGIDYGSITITDSDFSDNGGLGVDAFSVTSGITLNRVTATGNGGAGAYIESYSDDGAMLIQDSNFSDNGDFGLYTLSHSTSGTYYITLNRVTATGNIYDGAVIDVLSGSPDPQVLCGQFTGNGEYGLWLYLDTGVNAYLGGPDLSGNALGEYDLDYGTVTFGQCVTAGGGGGGEGGGGNSKANPQNVSAPTVSCNGGASVLLQPGEAFGVYEYLCGLTFQLREVTVENLPGELPAGAVYLAGMRAEVLSDGTFLDALPDGGRITLKFPIPEGTDGAGLTVMFRNGTEWVEVPGGQVIDGFYVVTVTMPGTYVLVSK